jgi:hypothetical protein
VPDADRARQLAGLHASLADALASPRERLRFAWAYQRNRPSLHFRTLVRDTLAHAARRQHRSSVRDQRHASAGQLVWLAGEAVCVVPEMVGVWPTPAISPPFYPAAAAPESGEEWITFPDGRRALLVRFTSFDPLGRLVAALREKPWRSPAATAGRVLFHLRRYGVPAPALLAFGQRFTSPVRAESFVLYSPPAGAVPVAARLAQLTPGARAALLRDCGRVLRSLHDAGCRVVPGDRPALVACERGASVESPFAVRLVKRLTPAARRADLRMLLRGELAGAGAAVTQGYDAHP